MIVIKSLIVLLLSGQLIGAPSSTAVTSEQGNDGWRRNGDGSIDYIIKLTPEFLHNLAQNGKEATFEIPPYVLNFMTKMTFQVGTEPVTRDPSIDELKAEYQKYLRQSESGSLSLLDERNPSVADKTVQIDRTSPNAGAIQNVSQNTMANSGTMALPSTSLNGNSAFSTPNPAFSTSNPALGSSTVPQTSNPALTGTGNTMSAPQFPQPQSSQPYPPSTSSLQLDPPSMGNSNGYSMSAPAVPSNPTNYGNSTGGTGTRINDLRSGVQQDGFRPIGQTYTGTSSNVLGNQSSFGLGNSGLYGSTGQLTSPPAIGANPFSGQSNSSIGNYGSNTTNGGYQGAYTGNYNNLQQPQARLAETPNNAYSLASTSSQVNAEAEIERMRQRFTNDLEQSKSNFQQLLTQDFNKKLSEAEAKNKSELFLFRILSLILFVACVYMFFLMSKLWQSYRHLQASSRKLIQFGYLDTKIV